VILSLIKSNNITDKNQTLVKSHGMNKVVYFIPDTTKIVKTNLLVVPHNLVNQWEDYIRTFSTDIRYKIINRQKYVDNLYEENFNIEDYDMLVVTGTFCSKVSSYLGEKSIKLQRLIVDEADNVNIPGCQYMDACFTWFVTASFGNLLYPKGYSHFEPESRRHICCATGLRNHAFVKEIFTELSNNIPSELLKILIVKNSEAFVEKSILLPPIYSFIIKCKTPLAINILNGIIDKNIIDCLNANDVSSALQFINPNNKGNEDNIVSLLIDKYKKQLTNVHLNLTIVNQMIFETDQERAHEVELVNNRINIINNKIQAITERVKENNVCIICYDTVDVNRTVTKCCQNTFCFNCINTWLMNKASCPMCKARMTSNDYLVINNSLPNIVGETSFIDTNITNESFDKYQNLRIILKNRKRKSKFLIFSSFEYSFINIVQILNELRINFEYLKGSGGHITNVVKRYKESDLDVLLVNIRNYGSGLNLENTTDIIMFHKESTQSEKQIIGRAHRMGKKDPLNIHYLVYANEVAASASASSSASASA
jgi:SNF2 family DNA or RNA helicase